MSPLQDRCNRCGGTYHGSAPCALTVVGSTPVTLIKPEPVNPEIERLTKERDLAREEAGVLRYQRDHYEREMYIYLRKTVALQKAAADRRCAESTVQDAGMRRAAQDADRAANPWMNGRWPR